MVSISLPGNLEVKVRRRWHDAHPHDPNDPNPAIFWMTYYDDEDRVARALCLELSLMVERDDVDSAQEAIRSLVQDYVDDFATTDADFLRPMPASMQLEHMKRLAQVLERHSDESGAMWGVGHLHVGHAKVPATATRDRTAAPREWVHD